MSIIYPECIAMTIPHKLHFIWFGSSLPSKYQSNLATFKIHNPNYKILLWIDTELLSKEEIAFMENFALPLGIELRNIRKYQLLNQDLITSELDQSRTDRKKMARIHFVRASDIARIGILFAEGGIYYDTDSKCMSAIPENIDSTHGFLSELPDLDELNLEEDSNTLLKTVFYHFIAAAPKSVILELTAKITRLDYDTYNNSSNKKWETLDDRQSLLEGTVKLTGTSLKWALNYLITNQQIPIKSFSELFFDSLSFVIPFFEGSWLVDFHQNSHAFDEQSLNNFCGEIEATRQRVYPLPRKLPLPHQFENEVPQLSRKYTQAPVSKTQKDIIPVFSPLTLEIPELIIPSLTVPIVDLASIYDDIKKRILLIESFKKEPRLARLFNTIETMRTYGESLSESSVIKGFKIKALTLQLDEKLIKFLLESTNSLPKPEQIKTFKSEFKALVYSRDKELAEHRAVWKPIVSNILIALTLIGSIAMVVKAVCEAIDALYNKKPLILNQFFFFGKTKSQELSESIDKSFDSTSLLK